MLYISITNAQSNENKGRMRVDESWLREAKTLHQLSHESRAIRVGGQLQKNENCIRLYMYRNFIRKKQHAEKYLFNAV
jgi:hypothetical protein